MALPKRLFRVTWQAAYGWPHPERRHETARNFTTAEAAGQQVATIRALPSHLSLTSVHTTDCEWSEFDVEALPIPTTGDVEDE